MDLTIDKKKIAQTIEDLPDDVTIEEAIERLVLLHKVQKGLQEKEGKTQEEVVKHFKKRRELRDT
jgi:hypothetical protein